MLLLKHYFKRISTVFIIVLVFIANYFTFIGIRSLWSTYQGYCEMKSLLQEGTYIANLDPESDCCFADITKSNVQHSFDYLDRHFNYALFSDGNIVSVPNCDMEISVNYLNEEYYNLFPLELEQGKNMRFDYKLNEDEIPVLIGKGLSNSYPLHSTINISDPALGRDITLKVVGILKDNVYHSNFYSLDWKVYYNFSIFVPINKSFIENANVDFYVNSIMNVIALNTTTEKMEALSENLYENLGLRFNFYTQEENNIDFKKFYSRSIIIQFIIASIMLVITIWISIRIITRVNQLLVNDLVSGISENINTVLIKKCGYAYVGITFLFSYIVILGITAYKRCSYWEKKDTLLATYGFGGLIDMDWGAWLVVVCIDMLISLIIVGRVIRHFRGLLQKQKC